MLQTGGVKMKLENVGMVVGGIVPVVALWDLPVPVIVVGTIVGTFIGWQVGCLAEIIWEHRNVTNPDPEVTDTEIVFRKYADLAGTKDDPAFIRRKPYIEDTYMDDDIKNT